VIFRLQNVKRRKQMMNCLQFFVHGNLVAHLTVKKIDNTACLNIKL
jgi:hypothetical protein